MKRILCYGDSNTWGHDPEHTDPESGLPKRIPWEIRWTGVLSQELGPEYQILEEGYCGRTTVFDDPLAAGRNGRRHLEVAFRSCDPVDAIVLMLGTNDAKDMFAVSAELIACGMERLLGELRGMMRASLSGKAKILLVSPIRIEASGSGAYFYRFSPRSTKISEQLAGYYRALAKRMGCEFLDASLYACPGRADGVHLNPENHRKLGRAMADKIREIL